MKKVAVFDYDGVIVDSFTASHPIVQDVWGYDEDRYRANFEGNAYGTDKPELPPEERAVEEERLRQFVERYSVHHDSLGVFDGMHEVIAELAGKYTLVIVSSTTDDAINRVLARTGLASYFTQVLGATTHRSKVVKLGMIMERRGVQSSDCVFITDTLGDIREARHHGIPAIGVLWGFHDRTRLLKDGPVPLAEQPSDLPLLVEQIIV